MRVVFAHSTIASLFRAINFAKEHNLRIEPVVILDKADNKTIKYFDRYQNSEIRLFFVDFGDLGLTRNFGIKHSSGKYISILDSDDLFSKDWLYKAFNFLESCGKDIVVHPEYQVIFDNKDLIWHQMSSCDSRFRIENLLEFNYWDAVCVARREIFL